MDYSKVQPFKEGMHFFLDLFLLFGKIISKSALYFLILVTHPPISGGLVWILYCTVHALFYRFLSCLLLAFGMLVWVASVILVFLYMISSSFVALLWTFSIAILCFILYGYHTATA